MKKKNAVIVLVFAVWASGIVVGAGVADLQGGSPSWSPWVILAIGLIISLVHFVMLFRAARLPG